MSLEIEEEQKKEKFLLNVLSQEVYGDYAQMLYLLACYCRANTLHLNALKTNLQSIIKINKPILFLGSTFNQLIDKIDSTFKNAI